MDEIYFDYIFCNTIGFIYPLSLAISHVTKVNKKNILLISKFAGYLMVLLFLSFSYYENPSNLPKWDHRKLKIIKFKLYTLKKKYVDYLGIT